MRYLSQRGDFFCFLRRIPTHLQPHFGYRREMRLSLGTRDRMTARKLVKQYDVEMDRLWVAARLKVSDEVIKAFMASSPLFAAQESVSDLKFSTHAGQFLQEKQATIRPDGIEVFKAIFREFTDAMKDRHVQAYSHADLTRYREHVMESGVKPTTVNRKLRYLSVFFNWLVTHEFIGKNPCKGLTIPKTEPDHELKKIFSPEDIDRWFTSPAFMQETCRDYQPQFFWIPLLALVGARIGELSQLRVADEKEVDGIWCLDINGSDGNRVKSPSSARLVPLPKFITDIGFLDYWHKRKDAGEERLFPIKFLKGNRPDYNYQVRRYVRNHITKDAKKTFHSFRATVATMLKNLGARESVPEALIAQILGHANANITMGRYGKPYPPPILLEALNKIDYKIDVKRLREVAVTFL